MKTQYRGSGALEFRSFLEERGIYFDSTFEPGYEKERKNDGARITIT